MLEENSASLDVDQEDCVDVDMDALVAYHQNGAFVVISVWLEDVQACIVYFKFVFPLDNIPWCLHLSKILIQLQQEITKLSLILIG